MSQILAIFGATGQQGGSILNYVLQDPELSKQYSIRAITRDATSANAAQLKEKGKVEVVQGDVHDPASLKPALSGVHTVFAVTTPDFGPDGFRIEYESGKAIADAAVEAGAKYIIFSTLPSPKEMSKGKYSKVQHFDAKAEIEQYIRGLPIKSAFVALGGYMQNYTGLPFFMPKKSDNDEWFIALPNSPTRQLALVDAVGDTGKFVGAILAEPDKYEGSTFRAAIALYSNEKVASLLSKSSGKKVVYKQVPIEEWKAQLPFAKEILGDVFGFMEEYNYFGAEAQKHIDWAAENARGRLTSFEEYLEANPLKLE